MSEHESEAAPLKPRDWYKNPVAAAGFVSALVAGLAGLITNYQTIIGVFKGDVLSIRVDDQDRPNKGGTIFVAFKIDNKMDASAVNCNIVGWRFGSVVTNNNEKDFSIPAHASDYLVVSAFEGIGSYSYIKAQISCKDHSSNNVDVKIQQ